VAENAKPDAKEVTTLLMGWRTGDREAGDQLIILVYHELKRLAVHLIRAERPDHTLQPTALVHELYLRLFGSEPIDWQNRAHFFAIAARQMRRVLTDYARSGQALKRGGKQVKLSISEIEGLAEVKDQDLLTLDEAIDRLAQLDHRAAQVVELRFFAGLEEKEAAAALGVSVATLKRDWQFARAWLLSRLESR
jgi:RNA polymerase sigma factor (TIGR02999 family)